MTDPDVADIQAANRAFYGAFESADLDAMTEAWADSSGTVCVHPGSEPLRGTPAILRSWALVMANTPYIQFFLTDVTVHVHGDLATVTCTENVLAAPQETTEATFQGGRAIATNVFVREPDGWRMWIHHASPVLSGAHHED